MSAGGFRTPKTTVWRSVTAKASVNNGHCKAIECNNCEATFAGGAARILEHILKCEGAPGSLSVWATEQLASREESRKSKEECKKLEQVFDDIATGDKQKKITDSMSKSSASKLLCDQAVSLWIYVTLQTFNVTAEASFAKMIDTIARFAPAGYKPPNPTLVRGKFLDEAYAITQEEAKEMFTDMEHMCALTIMSDGKTNNGKVPIVNYVAMSAKGAHFLAAVDMGLLQKDNKKMAEYLHEKCVATGFEKSFYLCVLDGALRSAFPHIVQKMPWMSCIWCSCHIISLFFKDCFTGDKGIVVLMGVLEKVKKIVRFIRDRQKPLAIFTAHSKKALILPGKCACLYLSVQIIISLLTPQAKQDMPLPCSPSTASLIASTPSTPPSHLRTTRTGYAHRTKMFGLSRVKFAP